ncbi:gliding motility protein GldN [Myroides injenensis]|uniref:type IX secretion system ring protein PorN/GldN n=1 Tax=Myroides injenensis TaxID=1183151 RepID=UPI000287C3D1|nr:gliding motility protein GldN [Myroides injenensis]
MNWKKFSLFVAFSLFSIGSFAQANLLNAKSASEIGMKSLQEILTKSDGPIPYGYINDKNLLFGIKVWENISLDEKANESYYFPIENVEEGERKSLFQVLIDGIKSGEITEVYDDSDFKTQRTLKDIEASFVRVDTTDVGIEYYNAGEAIPEEYIQRVELKPADVKEYHIMGMWYFDRNEGQLKYRLLGIAPVVADLYTLGSDNENYVELFWIFFADARNVLYQNYAYNSKNPLNPINFDHLLNSRRFSASIYKANNQYGDRRIDDYIKNNDLQELFEGEKIREFIRNLEDDMWNY